MSYTFLLGVLARGVSVAGNLALLPLILARFSAAEYAIWMIFLTSLSLSILADFGFGPAISRYLSYIRAGCRDLPTSRIGQFEQRQNSSSCVDQELFSAVCRTSNLIYLIVSIIVFLVLVAVWFLYLQDLSNRYGIDCQFEWFLYASAIAWSTYFNKYNFTFLGCDNAGAMYRSLMVGGISYVLIAIWLVASGQGLLGLVIAKCVSVGLHQSWCLLEIKRSPYRQWIGKNPANKIGRRSIAAALLRLSAPVGLAAVGAFCINRGSVFFAGYFLGAESSSQFMLGAQLFATLVSVAAIYMNIMTPKLNAAVYQNQFQWIAAIQTKIFLITTFLFLVGGISIVIGGNYLLNLVGSNIRLPPHNVLALFLGAYLIELLIVTSVNFLGAHNDVRYAKFITSTGIVYIFAMGVFMPHFSSVTTAIVIQILVQLIFSGWFLVAEVVKSVISTRRQRSTQ